VERHSGAIMAYALSEHTAETRRFKTPLVHGQDGHYIRRVFAASYIFEAGCLKTHQCVHQLFVIPGRQLIYNISCGHLFLDPIVFHSGVIFCPVIFVIANLAVLVSLIHAHKLLEFIIATEIHLSRQGYAAFIMRQFKDRPAYACGRGTPLLAFQRPAGVALHLVVEVPLGKHEYEIYRHPDIKIR